MSIPKEIVNEMAEFVQPKHKCIRVEYTYIQRSWNHRDEDYDGFKVTNGKKILILDFNTGFTDEDDVHSIITDPNIDTVPCANYKEIRQHIGWRKSMELKWLIPMASAMNVEREMGTHSDYGDDNDKDVYDSYLKYKVVEQF